jgi:hypothetical protein
LDVFMLTDQVLISWQMIKNMIPCHQKVNCLPFLSIQFPI